MRNLRRWLMAALMGAMIAPGLADGRLMRSNNTPFVTSTLITGASWISPRYGPPRNQSGDILPTVWADDGNQYTMMDDGETDAGSTEVWKHSLARVIGTPPHIRIVHVGDPTKPSPHTFAEIHKNPSLWAGPFGPYYSSGLVAAQKVLFATQENDWQWGINGPFTGLAGIAYSSNYGETWQAGGHPFPAPLGNLSWVIRGEGGYY